MTSDAGVFTRERMELAADACLLTSASFLLVTALAGLLVPQGEAQGAVALLMAAGSLLSLIVMAAAPILAWRLHGRPLTWTAILGGIVGGFLAGAMVLLISLVAMLLGGLTTLVAHSEFAGPLALLGVLAVAFLVVVVLMVIAALRDLSPTRRLHPRLDVIRLVAAGILALTSAGVGIWIANHPGTETGEALIMAMAAGLAGACAVGGAEIWTNRYGSAGPSFGGRGPSAR